MPPTPKERRSRSLSPAQRDSAHRSVREARLKTYSRASRNVSTPASAPTSPGSQPNQSSHTSSSRQSNHASSSTLRQPTILERAISITSVHSSDSEAPTVYSVHSSDSEVPTVQEFLQTAWGAAKGKAKGKGKGKQRAEVSIPVLDPDLLERIVKAFSLSAICPICHDLMLNPYVLKCGHTFCVACLRKIFEDELRAKLQNLGNCVNHQRINCQRVPTTISHRLLLKTALKAHGLSPKEVLKYSCPVCRSCVIAMPVVNYALKEVIAELRTVLLQQLEHLDLAGNSEASVSRYPFQTLFLL